MNTYTITDGYTQLDSVPEVDARPNLLGWFSTIELRGLTASYPISGDYDWNHDDIGNDPFHAAFDERMAGVEHANSETGVVPIEDLADLAAAAANEAWAEVPGQHILDSGLTLYATPEYINDLELETQE